MLLGLEGIPFLLMLAFWIWCFFDVITTDESLCRNLPKMVWVVIVLILPDVGAIAWLIAGRPQSSVTPRFTYGAAAKTAPRGPDDDTDFLHRVDRDRSDRLREAELELHRRELELREREEELRRRETGGGADPTPA